MKPFLNEGDKPCHNSISHVSTADSITLKVSKCTELETILHALSSNGIRGCGEPGIKMVITFTITSQ